MPRVRQSFTNELPKPIVVWVEMECLCWVIQPQERFTAEFDSQGYGGDFEPLPVELKFDGEGDDQLLMLVMYNQGQTKPSFFVDDEALFIRGEYTELGLSRFVSK